MPDINGIPYVEPGDLVSGYPSVSQSLAQEVSDQLASKLPYSFGTATPSSPGDGELWVDTSGSPNKPSVKFYDGAEFQPVAGLTLITAETFSAVSTVSLNDCFSADYENYRIIMYATTSATNGVSFRYRVSGVDASGSNYIRQFMQGVSATVSGATGSLTLSPITGNEVTGLHWASVEYLRPFAAAETLSNTISGCQKPTTEQTSTRHNLSTSYDGITIFPGGGTITGTVRVYGYKD